MRSPPRRAAIAILLAALSIVAPCVANAETNIARNVKVETSRGRLDLLVYAPEGAAPSGEASGHDPTGTPLPPCDPDPKPLVLLISGEGGWRSFDTLLAGVLAAAGYSVGGVDSMKYFWQAQDDRQKAAADFQSFAAALAIAAGRPAGTPLVLAGYSFGADLAPWLARASGWNGRLRGVVLIAPDETGSLEFRLSEILGYSPSDHTFSVAEAVRSVKGLPVLLIHGESDSGSAALSLASKAGEPKKLSVVAGAGHHFAGREEELRRALIEGLQWMTATPPAR